MRLALIKGPLGKSVTPQGNQNIEQGLIIPSKAVASSSFTLGQMRRGKAFIKRVPSSTSDRDNCCKSQVTLNV